MRIIEIVMALMPGLGALIKEIVVSTSDEMLRIEPIVANETREAARKDGTRE